MHKTKVVLPIIVISQFCCTSLWFAGNGVMSDLIVNYQLDEQALGHLTSSVQVGFILGTLIFAIFTIADRFAPAKVFMVCALLGALTNLGVIWEGNSLESILALRLLTGFFLAGIYPVGMKIAADHYEKGLGQSLSFLVGALVIGTAFPHLLNEMTNTFPWKYVLITTSGLAVVGGLLMVILVPNGPYRRPGHQIDLSAFFSVFKNREFRSAAFGYFGHMWELYAFWTFVPVMLMTYNSAHTGVSINVSLWSFLIIGMGGVACVLGGYLAQSFGTRRIAFLALLLSGGCCLFSPWLFMIESQGLFIGCLLFWGMVVIADSPLFSALVAQNTTPELKGTALTIVNCVGFSITIVSIQLINMLSTWTASNSIFAILAIGPFCGLIALGRK